MIIELLAGIVASLFRGLATLLKGMFPALYTAVSDGIATLVATPGGSFAMTLLDKAMGLTFLITMSATVISIYLTVRLVRFIMGVLSKG